MENKMLLTTAERNKMGLMNGLVLGLIYIIITTCVNLAAGDFVLLNGTKAGGYILYMVLLGVFSARIRKANGGYIEFRELFGPIFITLAIAWLMTYLYTYLYMYVIDTAYLDKLKDTTLQYMVAHNAKDEQLDALADQFDKSKEFSLSKSITGYFSWLIGDCLCGLIVCAIVKKNRPIFE